MTVIELIIYMIVIVLIVILLALWLITVFQYFEMVKKKMNNNGGEHMKIIASLTEMFCVFSGGFLLGNPVTRDLIFQGGSYLIHLFCK